MGSFIDTLERKYDGPTRERTSLPPSEKKKPYTDLKVVSYIGVKPGLTDSQLQRYSFLVASEGTEGTAFLTINLKAVYFHPAVLALAYGKVEDAIVAGATTHEEVDSTEQMLREDAKARFTKANPEVIDEDIISENAEKGYTSGLTGIMLNLETLFHLHDWAGITRPGSFDELGMDTLVGTVFTGTVKAGKSNSEVGSVYRKK